MSTEFVGRNATYIAESQEPLLYGRLSVLLHAREPSAGQEVLVKLFPDTSSNPDSLKGFFREIEAIRALRHPGILNILDYGGGTQAARSHFLVLPYIRGGNLRGITQGRAFVPPTEANPLLRQVAAAIDFAHANGVIHGDIKPENILVSEDRTLAYLADFGVSRHFDVVDRLTITVQKAPEAGGGTSAYLSPEQLSENRQSPKSDLYSFGLVAYELLVGGLPYDVSAPLYQQLHARVSGDLADPQAMNSTINDAVARALKRVLDADPKKRPPTAAAFVSMLGTSTVWDIFLAHSSQDTAAAEELYGHLTPQRPVFLDTKCVRPGDNWDETLRQAQRDSKLTVVIVSARTGTAYYAREEIAIALQQARQAPGAHRVVPLFLDDESLRNPPYGLALKHGLALSANKNLKDIAQELDRLLDSEA